MNLPSKARFMLRALLAILALFTLLVGPLAADMPDKFTNLKVLPKEISKQDLLDAMRGYSNALGVRCGHCHMRPQGDPKAEFDWASDALPAKETARVMMRMTKEINQEELSKITTKHPERVEVKCRTCHRGQPQPWLVDDLLSESYTDGGFDSLTAKYAELRAEYYGSDTYDFGPHMIPTLAERLAGRKNPELLLKFAQLELKWFPESGYAHLFSGQAHAANGDKETAIEEASKAMELDPELKENAEWVIGQARGK